MVAAIKVPGKTMLNMGLGSMNAKIGKSFKELLKMGSFMEKREPITSRMDALTRALGKITSSRDKDRLYARTAYHITVNS